MLKDNRPTSSKRFPEDEKEKQKFRKMRSPSSRFLDNYYNPNIYDKSWWPNGLYLLKKEYQYSESGLCFNYEKNNTLQKRLVWEQDDKKTKIMNFLEYDYLQEKEYIITIEYCANCRDHQIHTQHSSELFKNVAVNLQKCIQLRFPFIKVLLKPIDTDIKIEPNLTNQILHRTKIIDEKFKEVRIGALEVQICYLREGKRNLFSLYSKLQSGNWPSISNILNNIVSHLPLISCDVKLYDKESENSHDRKENSSSLLKTHLEGLKVNLYKNINEQIENILKNTKEEISIFTDPKKRLEKKNEIMKISKSSEIKRSNSQYGTKNAKGDLLITLYTDRNGMCTIQNIPYDSYLIEVEESSNFQTSNILLNFKQIENENKVVKFIGLKGQTNSYLQVFIFHNGEETLADCDVIIHSNSLTSEEKVLYEEQEMKVKLKENKNIKGRYEAILVPGKYTLNVSKKGFDVARKSLQIKPGENKVNLEMSKEQKYNLKITILAYENYKTIENANIKLSFGSEDGIEGVSDTNGLYIFSTPMKEDFLTIFVDKPGYLPAQRTYVRDVSATGKEEQVTRNIIIVLVKEQLILKEQAIVMVTYSNLLDDNFEPVYLYSKNSIFYFIILVGNFTDISCNDSQVENGVLTSYFKYHQPKREELLEEEEELDEIIRLMFRIKTKRLKKEFKFDQGLSLNGLQRFSCECVLYTPNNTFYIAAPSFSREKTFEYWDVGFLDIKNTLFYEISLLSNSEFEKNLFFFEITNFLQILIDKKAFSKLFENFEFGKGHFLNNDRYIYEPTFLKALRNLTGDYFSADFLLYVCDMMKTHNKMIAYSVFKKKITSNLKNFREILKLY